MALLRRKQDTGKTATTTKRTAVSKSAAKTALPGSAREYVSVIRPHVTEKSILLSERGTYAFKVFPYANKKQIAEFVRTYYGVTPIAVRIAKKGREEKIIRGRWGTKAGLKKAYVTLKKGDTIDFA